MIRVGILGADSSHTDIYLQLTNEEASPFSGRALVTRLWGNDPREAERKASGGVTIAPTIDEALLDIDLAIVCGRWGEDHYEPALAALYAGIPVFVDKPFTNDVVQAQQLQSLASRHAVPAFSCSPYRFSSEMRELAALLPSLGEFRSGTCAGLAEWPALGPRARNSYFYGVHPVEVMHTVFGPGFQAVRQESSNSSEVANIRYADGRHVFLHLLRDCSDICQTSYYGSRGWAQRTIDPTGNFYQATLEAAIRMAETGQPPIPLDYAVEIISLLDAIEKAREDPGWVSLRC